MSNYNIGMAAKLSGVSELVIRAWENRYDVLSPERTVSNRRLYTESDIEKLVLLGKLTRLGHRIGDIANLEPEVLKEMLSKSIDLMPDVPAPSGPEREPDEFTPYIIGALNAARNYDQKEFLSLLTSASIKYSGFQLIDNIILPVIENTGKYWREGVFRVSHEHFASACIVKFLHGLSGGFRIEESAPSILIATPEGQYHENGALIASTLASAEGWKTVYLGASLPAEDIVSAARELNIKVLYLSIVYPEDSASIFQQLYKIRQVAGDELLIIAGGKAIKGYLQILNSINAFSVQNSMQFRSILETIRKRLNPNEK